MKENLYGILGLEPFSAIDEVKSAFRNLAKIHHPDVVRGNEEQYKRIYSAYELLSSASEKEKYDEQLRIELAQEQARFLDTDIKLQIVAAWCSDREFSGIGFVQSVINQYADKGYISVKQDEVLNSFFEKYNIDVNYFLENDRYLELLHKYIEKIEKMRWMRMVSDAFEEDLNFKKNKVDNPFSAFTTN